MATEQQAGAISAAFPAPPPFYKAFTPENLELLEQYINPSSQTSTKTLHSSAPSIPSIADLSSLPPKLRHLVPPAPPLDGKYRSFGSQHDIIPPTSTPQEIPTREHLLNLTDQLMRQYHQYVQILATNPSGELWVPQWEKIKKTFEEIHRVINEYRPHEARESLILRYEDQIKQVREETEKVKSSVERARQVVSELGSGVLTNGDPGTDDDTKDITMKTHKVERRTKQAIAREESVLSMIDSEVGGA